VQIAPIATTDDRENVPPVIRAVDEFHAIALRSGASDIHIEPMSDGGRVRYRIDGILRDGPSFGSAVLAQIVSRIKLLASMDIAERRQPQDGRYPVEFEGRSVDARVSSMPTIDGEKLVVRLLDVRARVPNLESLGMLPETLAAFRAAIHAPFGFVVVCGPTGSGKTTTLYASLAERNVEAQQLCSVEDPVEMRLAGVAQVQVNERAGLTFANALRSFLRQDPNVLMVGEMRDAETAKVALSAALSGQLIMTTLHAADAPRSIERLVELGLSRRAIAAGLSGVLAQRLVRRLCAHCTAGCACCNGSGYNGRSGIFEFLPIGDDVREAIASGESAVAIATRARSSGYRPMLVQGLSLARDGATTQDELKRVLALESVA
jgi:general secretion pathway protein E